VDLSASNFKHVSTLDWFNFWYVDRIETTEDFEFIIQFLCWNKGRFNLHD